MPQSAGSSSTALVVIEEAPRRGFRFTRLPRWPGSGIGFLGVAGLFVSFYAASIHARAVLLDAERLNHEKMQAKVAEERAVREEQREEERAKLAEQRAVRAEQRAVRAEERAESAEKRAESAEQRAERAEKASGSGGWFGSGKK